jgi:hypothetical protein
MILVEIDKQDIIQMFHVSVYVWFKYLIDKSVFVFHWSMQTLFSKDAVPMELKTLQYNSSPSEQSRVQHAISKH